ncbi:MAG: hypothetical protein GX811_10045 [Lentisphaerae bacterium]|nr:hypothetical protein [Lentisphaerota bacterium]
MKHYPFGTRSGFLVPKLSMGAMRFPEKTEDAVKLIRHAIDSGFKYIDTCRRYGDSELKLKEALKDGYRDKVILSTKWAPWHEEGRFGEPSAEIILEKIEESMERLEVNMFDFYQAWDISTPDRFQKFTAKGGMLDGILEAKKRGLLNHIGMTVHDLPENVIDYLKKSDWIEVLLVTYNMNNRDYASTLEVAKKLGIGTIVMNPVGGGLFGEESATLSALAEEVGAFSVPDMAIRYAQSNSDIDTVLVGISKISDVDDSIASIKRGPFADDALEVIDRFFDLRRAERKNFCSKCNYCMPCPQGVNIPTIMEAVFLQQSLGVKNRARRIYEGSGEKKAEACNKCGLCEEKCTQKLQIREHLDYALHHIAATS